MHVLAKIIINKNLFNKVKSFCLHFVNKSDFGWLSSVHQKKLDEVKQVYVFDFQKSYLNSHRYYSLSKN